MKREIEQNAPSKKTKEIASFTVDALAHHIGTIGCQMAGRCQPEAGRELYDA